MMQKWLSTLLLWLAIGWLPAVVSADAIPEPQRLVQETSEKMIAVLQAEQAVIEAQPDRLYDLVADIVLPHFDFERMARWVLGKYWRQATPEQQQRFTAEFRTLLVRTYGTALFDYNDQTINYLPLHMADGADKVTVRTEIEQPGGPAIPISYSLYLNNGEWKVYDVAVEGVSLVTNYRSSFAATVSRSSIAALIDDLVERNKSVTLSDADG